MNDSFVLRADIWFYLSRSVSALEEMEAYINNKDLSDQLLERYYDALCDAKSALETAMEADNLCIKETGESQ